MSQAWDPPAGAPWQPAAPYTPAFASGPRKRTDGGAVLALVLAIISFAVWIVPAVIAIFVASGAKRNIKASPDTRKGKDMATAAQIVSLVSILVSAVLLTLISLF